VQLQGTWNHNVNNGSSEVLCFWLIFASCRKKEKKEAVQNIKVAPYYEDFFEIAMC